MENQINFDIPQLQNYLKNFYSSDFHIQMNDELSCLKQLRYTSFSNRTAASLAHSGIILPKRCRIPAFMEIGFMKNMDSSETLRAILFVNMIENLCVSNDGHNYDHLTCKCLVCIFKKLISYAIITISELLFFVSIH